MTVEPVLATDAPAASKAAAEPRQPPISKNRPTPARDGWAA
jgi:hypothetical protein